MEKEAKQKIPAPMSKCRAMFGLFLSFFGGLNPLFLDPESLGLLSLAVDDLCWFSDEKFLLIGADPVVNSSEFD